MKSRTQNEELALDRKKGTCSMLRVREAEYMGTHVVGKMVDVVVEKQNKINEGVKKMIRDSLRLEDWWSVRHGRGVKSAEKFPAL